MRYHQILTEARRIQDEHGNRFLLNPSVVEFRGYFRGRDGAAFYIDTHGNLALGSSPTGSIDHSQTAETFGLDEEAARGFILLNGSVTIEVWAEHSSDEIAPADQAKVQRTIQFATNNPSLKRLATSWHLTVFNEDYVEIDSAVL